MNITRIVVMTNTDGTDRVHVHTSLPSPFPVDVSKDALTLDFRVRAGFGVEYVQTNFPGARVENLDAKTGKTTVVRP